MVGLVAAVGDISETSWGKMVGDLALFGPLSSWGPAAGTRIGITGPAGHRSVLTENGSVVLVDGIFDDPRPPADLVAHYHQTWGVDGLRRLPTGEFAFVIWDAREGALLAGCDAVGTRALAYFASPNLFLLASRALALLRVPAVPRALDDDTITGALTRFWVHSPGGTTFSSIRRIRPGRVLTVRAGAVSERSFAELSPTLDQGARSAPQCFDAFRARIDTVTRRALRVGDPLCATLSGGIDSSMVAASLARAGQGADVFFMGTEETRATDEAHLIAPILRKYGTMRLHRVPVDDASPLDDDADSALPDDPPFDMPELEPARRAMLRAVRSAGFRGLLVGEGGDEVFGAWTRWTDAIGEGDVRSLFASLAESPFATLKSVVRALRSHLPGGRERNAAGLEATLPPWLRPRPAVLARALERQLDWEVGTDFPKRLRAALDLAGIVHQRRRILHISTDRPSHAIL